MKNLAFIFFYFAFFLMKNSVLQSVMFTLKNKNSKEKFKLMYVQVKDMYICIKKGKSTRFLALKIWALAVLKFFDVVLKFELPNARVFNFPQNSAPSLIGPVLINGDCVYHWEWSFRNDFTNHESHAFRKWCMQFWGKLWENLFHF